MTWEEIGFFGFQGVYSGTGQVVFSAAVLAGAVGRGAHLTRLLPFPLRRWPILWVARPEPLAMGVSATNAVGAARGGLQLVGSRNSALAFSMLLTPFVPQGRATRCTSGTCHPMPE